MIVITGINGRLGRSIATTIATLDDPGSYRFTTRDPGAAADFVEQGFGVVPADYADVGSVRKAFDGAETVLLISATGTAATRIPLHRNAIQAATEVGVTRLVYTSRVNPSAASAYPFAAIHADSEQRIVESGLEYVILRNNEFTENLDPWLAEACESGSFTFGAKGPIAFIARADVVSGAINALSWQRGTNTVFEMSGPEALDRTEIAARLAEAIGRPIRAADGDRDDFAQTLHDKGRPDFVVEMGRGLFDASASGEWAEPSSDPQLLNGRAAESMSQYIRRKFTPSPA
jgi:NAD(P)H dehydrogenase (quinone)